MRQPHALIYVQPANGMGAPYKGICRCGEEFRAWTKREVRDAHREHKQRELDLLTHAHHYGEPAWSPEHRSVVRACTYPKCASFVRRATDNERTAR